MKPNVLSSSPSSGRKDSYNVKSSSSGCIFHLLRITFSGNKSITSGTKGRETCLSEGSREEKRKKLVRSVEKCERDLKALRTIVHALTTTLPPGPAQAPEEATKKPKQIPNEGESIKLIKQSRQVINDGKSTTQSTQILDEGETVKKSKQILNIKEVFEIKEYMDKQLEIMGKKKNNIMIPRRIGYKIQRRVNEDMIDCINKVCGDIVWGEMREMRKIGFALQEFIFKELIDEIVKEFPCFFIYSFPYDTCRKKLVF